MRSDPNTISIGQELRARRKALGLSQEDVAAVAGITRKVLSELENGRSTVGLGIVLRVAQTLGLDVRLEART